MSILSVFKERVKQEINARENSGSALMPNQILEELLSKAGSEPGGLNLLYEELGSLSRPGEKEMNKVFELFDTAPFGYYRLNSAGEIEDLNHTGAALLKTPKPKLFQTEFARYVCPGMRNDFGQFLQRIAQSGRKGKCQLKLQGAFGEVYCRMEGTILPAEDPDELKYYLTLFDVTENRRSALANFETSQRLKMVLEASSAGILTIDLCSLSVYLDTFSCTLLNIRKDVFKGTVKEIIRSIHPEDRLPVNRALKDALADNHPIDISFRNNGQKKDKKFLTVKGHRIVLGDQSFFAGLLMDQTQQHRLEKEAESLRVNQQKMIMNATIKAQEKERAALSQFLHNSICQLLYGIKLNLQSMQFSNRYKGPFQNINSLLDRVIKETRDISYELTPSVFRDFGFIAGIKEMFQRLSTPEFSIVLESDEQMDALNHDVQLYLFRIIQELINNCIKHASASMVHVRLAISNRGWVQVTVQDNGKGFGKSIDEALREGSGIRGIKNRLFLLNGTISFSTSEKGVKVKLTFPTTTELMEINNKL